MSDMPPINTIVHGDTLSVLRNLPDNYVQCVVTSPPYYGLRSYLPDGHADKHLEIGLEETPQEYTEKLVLVFREVRRILRPDGICWINLGDSFAGGGSGGASDKSTLKNDGRKEIGARNYEQQLNITSFVRKPSVGFKSKDLLMIPARVAIALQEDGWILRQDCIWHKPTAMPESVTDRPTSAHEHLFLLAKSERYFYDAKSIAEPAVSGHSSGNDKEWEETSERNKRSVWTVNTQPYPEAHFATMPPKLVEPCILAGTSPVVCEHCGAPWQRIIVPTGHINKREPAHAPHSTPTKVDSTGWAHTKRATDQWQPNCKCPNNTGGGKSIVLDPFCGAGTTPLVALQHNRNYLGIELNPDYIALAQKRIAIIQPNLWSIPMESDGSVA